MRTFMRLLFISLCVAAMTVASRAQTQPATGQQGDPKVVVNAGEVLFDVVVRDKKGRAVNDLSPTDFEVYEDGVAQQVNSFRLVTRNNAKEGASASVAAGSNSKPGTSSMNQPAVPVSSMPGGADASPRLSAVAIVF